MVGGFSCAAAAEVHVAEPGASSVRFSVRNLLARVQGAFKAFDATIEFDRDHPERSQVSVEIDVASLDTREPKRDAHLQQPEFFDAAKHPRITFRSTAWKKTGPDEFEVVGNLAIRGITRPVTLKVRAPDFSGASDRRSWEAATRLNRHDFGVSAYHGVIGAEVEITIRLATARKR